MDRRPYDPLPPPAVEVALALVSSGKWPWPRCTGIDPGGQLLEVRSGAHPARDVVPYLVDPATAGHVLHVLVQECEPRGILWSVGVRRGQGRSVVWARLEAGLFVREFTGETLGEAAGRALLARFRRGR